MPEIVKRFISHSSFRFGVLTIISFFGSIGLAILFVEVFGTSEKLGVALSLVVVFFVNFLLGRYFVFGSNDGSFFHQLLKFGLSSGLLRGVEYALFLLFSAVTHSQYIYLMIISKILLIVVKYFVCHFFVFKKGKL